MSLTSRLDKYDAYDKVIRKSEKKMPFTFHSRLRFDILSACKIFSYLLQKIQTSIASISATKVIPILMKEALYYLNLKRKKKVFLKLPLILLSVAATGCSASGELLSAGCTSIGSKATVPSKHRKQDSMILWYKIEISMGYRVLRKM